MAESICPECGNEYLARKVLEPEEYEMMTHLAHCHRRVNLGGDPPDVMVEVFEHD